MCNFASPVMKSPASSISSQSLTLPGGIAAELVLPDGFDPERERCTLAILMHGFLGSKRGAPLPFLSRVLLREGVAVLRFDFDGYGESEGAQQDNTIPRMLEDAKTVWDYACTLPFVERIVLLGHSQGGVVAGMLAGRLERAGTPPAGLVLLAAASIIQEFARKGRIFTVHCDPANPPERLPVFGYDIGREYILSAQCLPIAEESAWYTGPVCVVQGTWDPIVPVSCAEQYHQGYKHSELHTLLAAGHLFHPRRRRLRRLLLLFLRGLR